MVTAGGTWCCDSDPGGTLLVKLLDPPRWVQAIYPILRSRARATGISIPIEIGIDVGSQTWRLVVSRRSGRLVEDRAIRADFNCDAAVFAGLLVGNLETADLRDKILPATANSGLIDSVAALFPPAVFWQSHFDALRY